MTKWFHRGRWSSLFETADHSSYNGIKCTNTCTQNGSWVVLNDMFIPKQTAEAAEPSIMIFVVLSGSSPAWNGGS